MKGLELSRRFYEAYGEPMLRERFPHLLPCLAVGLSGSGSERFGFDDEISRDHDFEPGFCIFLPGEDIVSERDAFLLERAYAKLPKEFEGVVRPPLSPVGGNRCGPMRTSDFFSARTGTPDGKLSPEQWLTLPDAMLAEAVNGEIFYDGYGEVTEIRKRLSQMPDDIRRKRLAGNLLLAAQSGQYNYSRCLSRGEPEAASLACTEFVRAAMQAFFLLSRRYMPYYKWSFRALRLLPGSDSFADGISFLLTGNPAEGMRKAEIIEALADELSGLLRTEGLSNVPDSTLEAHAYAVNDGIRDGNLRNLHILAAV